MPSLIHAKVLLQGRSEHDYYPGAEIQVDITCIRGLLDDVRAIHTDGFQSVFGTTTVDQLLMCWQQSGVTGRQIQEWAQQLRKTAFEAESLGEFAVEFRNRRDLPDLAGGVVPVLCGIFEYLAGCCGSVGVVSFSYEEEKP